MSFEINWENIFENKIKEIASNEDPAHDLMHFRRIVSTAKILCQKEKADAAVVIPAAWLHDFVIIPKNDPRRSQASRLAAQAALEFLNEIKYPNSHFGKIKNAIEAHSFSANIPCESVEAMIVQDADRLDGLGAIGVARCFATAGLMKRAFYCDTDPFCDSRTPNDKVYTIDHFFEKLFKTAETLKTNSGKQLGVERIAFMKTFLGQLGKEIA